MGWAHTLEGKATEMKTILTLIGNALKQHNYHRKELRMIQDMVKEREERIDTLRDGYNRQMNTIELQRIKIEQLEASNALKAREIIMLKREVGELKRRGR